MIYDFVVVGAGAGGCAAAARLAERQGVSVLLLEAGSSDRHPLVWMPKGLGLLHRDRRRLWHHEVEAQDNPPRPKETWLRGRMLGGTSSINGMVYTIGQPQDYNDWAAAGATGWDWASVAPHFRALEDHFLPKPGVRGSGGPMPITLPDHLPPSCQAFLQAAEALGHPPLVDLNDAPTGGVGRYFFMTRKGRRFSAADAFLRPALRTGRLQLRKNCEVRRILTEGGQAVGVEAMTAAGTERIRARHIILAAGTIGSPTILLRSGIGPGQDLQALGLPVVADLPHVGRNMTEHIGTFMTFPLLQPGGNNLELQGARLIKNAAAWLLGRGILSFGPYEVGGFLADPPASGRPEFQIYASPISFRRDAQGRMLAYRVERREGFTMIANLLRPVSTGNITIGRTGDGFALRIRPAWLSDPRDQVAALRLVRAMQAIATSSPLREILGPEEVFGPVSDSDDKVLERFITSSKTSSHAAGTCRMAASAAEGVTDPTLRVHGVGSLSVADLSVAPTMISGNTAAPTMVIGQRCSDFLTR